MVYVVYVDFEFSYFYCKLFTFLGEQLAVEQGFKKGLGISKLSCQAAVEAVERIDEAVIS